MKKLDIHTHIMPEKIPNWFEKYGYGSFISLQQVSSCCTKMMKGDKLFREVSANSWDPALRIADMEATGVTMQVLSTVPVLFNYWANPQHTLDTARYYNDHIAQVVQLHPDRFIGLGTVPLQDTDLAIQELERCMKTLGMAGVEIGTNVNQINLSDARFDAFWEAAQALDACIFVHPWEMMGEAYMEKYWLPWLVGMPAETSRAICSLIFGGIIHKYPKLRFAFAHGGGSFPATIGRVQHGHDCRPDLVAIDNVINPRDYIGKFWIDSLVHDADTLDYIIKVMGADRICLGSDYPYPLGELNPPGKLIAQLSDAKVQQQLMWDNAWEWLGTPAHKHRCLHQ